MTRTRLIILLPLLISATGFAQRGAVHTDRPGAKHLPLPREDGVWHFVVYGDRTGGPRSGVEVLRQAVTDTNLLDPDLVMTVGDLVQGYNAQQEWLEQAREFHDVMNRLKRPWYPVAGNHDVYWRGPDSPLYQHEANYEEHFGPLWYWFRHKNAGFVVLYTDEGDRVTGEKGFRNPELQHMSPAQRAWLEKTLAHTRSLDHVFVFLHHPRWVAERYEESDWEDIHAMLARAGNVTAVFAGHIHQMRYDGKRDGIEYFALATTGGSLSAKLPEAGYLHHFNVVTVRRDSLAVATIPVGAVIDPRSISGELASEIDTLLDRKAPRIITALKIGGEAEVIEDVFAFEIENPVTHAIDVTATLESDSKRWQFSPDHVHATIEPGAKHRFEIGYRLLSPGQGGAWVTPRLAVGLDWRGADRRITLPEKKWGTEAVLVGIPAPTDAERNGALHLTGGAVEVPSRPLGLRAGPFTVEGWVLVEEITGERGVVAKTQQSEFGLSVTDGIPEMMVWVGGGYRRARNADLRLETGRWYHLAGTHDENEVKLWVDGRLVATAEADGKRKTNSLPLYVGAEPDGSGDPNQQLRGRIDEVRVSKVVRYRDPSFTPAARLEADADTLLLLHLDRDFGPFTPDDSGRAVHGKRHGSVHCKPR